MNKKSQSAIEFVVLVAFILFFFTAFFLAIKENTSDKIREKNFLMLKDLALTVQNELNLASQSTDGYFREFDIPDRVGNQNYDINIINEMVYINTTDNKYAMALPVANVTGNVNKGTNIIKKENGEVKLNP